ncbi:hypothetical protein TrVE_jg12561 [Triparma verrucosa]|uniref:Uncharacterized protein n=1 Tax=Triparma verrucosa TaxID=1606542 RepID=A0A9W7B3V9_9STRA|nr:hypothetical protein TrVE_jg12561 [Triparma verrucosa]
MSSFTASNDPEFFNRLRADTYPIKEDMKNITKDFEEQFDIHFKEFIDLRKKPKKSKAEKADYEEKFNKLKEEATNATEKLQPTIQSCMHFYRTAGGPGHFHLDKEFIKNMELTKQQLDDDTCEDNAEKAGWLIEMGEEFESKFQEPIEELVKCLNNPGSNYESVALEYGLSLTAGPAKLEVDSTVLEKSTQKQGRVLKREGQRVRVQYNGEEETPHWVEINNIELVDRGFCPPGRPMLYRNDTFVLDKKNPDNVVRHKFGPLKDAKRGKQKLDAGKQLTDINRVTLEFEDPKMLELAYRCIEKGLCKEVGSPKFEVCRVDNKLEKTDQPACIHLNIAIASDNESPDEFNWICECQMYLRSILRIKTTSHTFYNVKRAEKYGDIKGPKEKKKGTSAGEETHESKSRERELKEQVEAAKEQVEAANKKADDEARRRMQAERDKQDLENEKEISKKLERTRIGAPQSWPAFTKKGEACKLCLKKGRNVFCHFHK